MQLGLKSTWLRVVSLSAAIASGCALHGATYRLTTFACPASAGCYYTDHTGNVTSNTVDSLSRSFNVSQASGQSIAGLALGHIDLYAGADLLDYPLSAYDPASEWKTPAGAFGEIRETLYFTGGSATGYFRPVYHIEGSFTDTKAGGLIPSLFLCQGVFFAGGDVCSPVQIDAGGTGPVDVFWQPPADSATTRFVFGQPFNLILFFRTSLSIDPSLGSGSLITDNANASFLGSVTIASLNITDSNGDSIAGARSLSDSGLFGVPEPGTLCLCGAALGLAAFGRRLRRPVTDA